MPDKERERHYLRLFQTAAGLPESLSIEVGETPDFVLGAPPHRIGIELTEFYLLRPGPDGLHKEQHSLRERAMGDARRAFRAAGGPAVYVWAYFREEVPIRKRRVASLALELARAVKSQLPLVANHGRDLPRDHLPAEILYASVLASVDGEDEGWSVTWTGWVEPVQATDVELVIRNKSARAHGARPRCDQLWLVIVDDPFLGGAPCGAADEVLARDYSHLFDRVIWFQPHADRIREVGSPSDAAHP